MESVFIIAEAGVNHNGSLETAKLLVEKAAWAGADAVKFQTFKAKNIISPSAPKAAYQHKITPEKETQYEMIKRLELDEAAHFKLIEHCKNCEIEFLSSPFDLEGIDLLSDLGLKKIKIPSGEITNYPLLEKIGELNKDIFLSTGMSTLEEINEAVNIFERAGTPQKKITILHCNTEYPTPFCDVNLRAMQTIKKAFTDICVGYSDHTTGIEVAIAATAMEATVIEKHFTIDRTMRGPDHSASVEPEEFKNMVAAIRNIELAMGNGIKKPSASEQANIRIVRKSIVAAKQIQKGEFFTKANLTVKRPGTGISPMEWDIIIGKKSTRNYVENELILPD